MELTKLSVFARGLLDLDGRPVFIDGIVDIGADEFDPRVHPDFTVWLQYYRLTTDGSAGYTAPTAAASTTGRSGGAEPAPLMRSRRYACSRRRRRAPT